jgi:hypothetical protein
VAAYDTLSLVPGPRAPSVSASCFSKLESYPTQPGSKALRTTVSPAALSCSRQETAPPVPRYQRCAPGGFGELKTPCEVETILF